MFFRMSSYEITLMCLGKQNELCGLNVILSSQFDFISSSSVVLERVI